ncbi:MFS transporter [Ectobacillus ponti]|uniref:MFS transporter n=1 Tax=Ectobacillus ponti TaxID=2961894 RepID=A0AA41X717_9BACI|nr:MFS transporter [Ectobacillus ponti]MCP8967500.1 MFS transporter [Ectobacillus ponti]
MGTKEIKRARSLFQAFNFAVFFGFGALYPLLGVYLQQYAGLNGGQIGNIMSAGPIVMLLAQPLWGMLCDYTQRPRHVLLLTLVMTVIAGYLYASVEHYAVFLIIAIGLALGQSALIPISDSMALSFVQKHGGSYGGIRLYGAIGFALAGVISGKATDLFGMHTIFYMYMGAMLTAASITMLLPKEGGAMRVDIRAGAAHLLRQRDFVLFLLCTFLIFGPVNANNTYFGLLIMQLGGTLTGVGFAFLLAAGSEAPFMRFASGFIGKMGLQRVLILAAAVASARWLLYTVEPPLSVVYATTVVQGVTVGLFIPAALQHVRSMAPAAMQVTAVSLYAAAGGGLGAWFCTFVGGILMERFGVASVYVFFALLTFSGVLLFLAQGAGGLQKGELTQKESAS